MLHDPYSLPKDGGDGTPVGTLVGCPAVVGIHGMIVVEGMPPCEEGCPCCGGAGAVTKIGFSSYQRMEGYR